MKQRKEGEERNEEEEKEKECMQMRRLFIRNMQEREEGQTEADVRIDTAFQIAELRKKNKEKEAQWEEDLWRAWRLDRRKFECEKQCLRPIVKQILYEFEVELEELEMRTGRWFF